MKPTTGTTAKPPAKAKAAPPKKASTPRTSAASKAAEARTAAKQKVAAKAKPAAKPRPAARPKTAPTPTARAAATAAEPRRFAWAPVAGAIGYHVELFKGTDRVLSKETTEPVLELGQTWRYEGRTMRLTTGSYRWYVWPVTKSGRATQAVVQATLDIP